MSEKENPFEEMEDFELFDEPKALEAAEEVEPEEVEPEVGFEEDPLEE